ncbi:MAG: hypothetical protein ABMA02_07400 [Saprospiraceae bacterium]
MTKHFVSLACFFWAIGVIAAQDTGKTFTKPFSTEGAMRVKFDLPGPIDLKIWNQATIRIEISVSLPSGSSSMLDQLAGVGRYDLRSVLEGGELVVTSPNMNRLVRVKGEKLKENITYVAFVPKEMEVVLLNSAAVAEIQNK